MPTKDSKNVIQTPSGGAPAGDGFFDKESVVPPAEARLPDPPAVESPAEPGPGLVHLEQPPVAGVAAPDLTPPAAADDGLRTPDAWARELGHVDAPSGVSADEAGAVAKTKRRRPIREAKGWIFAAVKAHTGWGKQLPIDVLLSRADYEEAVAEALGTPIGTPGKERALKWRHDVVAAAKAEAQKTKSEAEKAGGER